MFATLALAFVPAAVQVDRPFPTPAFVPGALGGEFRARGDYDGDGDVDLVWFAKNGFDYTGVTIFFNDGAGGFAPGPHTPFAHGTDFQNGSFRPYPGDFDGDGNLDFALALDGPAAPAGEGVEFFLGDGAGSFPSRPVLLLTTPLWIGVGNLDGDAADEVFVHHANPSFQRFLRWVDFQGGVPTALPTLELSTASIPNHFIFEALDVDGDGIDDVVATQYDVAAADGLTFFPTVSGTPTLGQQFVLPVEMHNVNHRLASGDLDGDGDEDLAVVKFNVLQDSAPYVQVLERSATGWSQRPVVQTSGFTAFFGTSNLGLADWNGDGWLDIVSDANTGGVLASDGAWGYAVALEERSTGSRNGAGAFDVDGDGNMDLVGGSSILFGDGGFEASATTFVSFATFLDGQRFRDLEGDGDLDVVGAAGGQHARNDGSGGFSPALGLPAPSILPPLTSPLQWAQPMASGDFDGDGRPEFLATFYEQLGTFPFGAILEIGTARIPEDGQGGYLPGIPVAPWGDVIATPPPTSDFPFWSTGDADGDGDEDLLLVNGYRENDGNGRLETFVAAWTGRGRQAADVNADGFADVLVTREQTGTTQVWVHFGGAGGSTPTFVGNAPGEADAAWRDLDGDGDLDVAIAAREQLGLRLFENVGGAFPGPQVFFPDAKVPALRNLGVTDVDGDGVLDLYVLEVPDGLDFQQETVAVYLGTPGALGYVEAARHLSFFGAEGFADLDSDGDLDVVGAQWLAGSLVEGEGGAIHQAGDGVAGTGGYRPLLGATGPVRSTSGADELRLVNALGGSSFILVFGTIPTSLVDSPIPGLVQYVADPILFPLLPLGGAPGVAGAGHVEVALPNVAGLYGLTFVHQAFVIDAAAPAGWSASNGLAITYGE